MLVLVKMGQLSPLREKEISAAINTYVRSPGLVVVGTLAFACGMQSTVRAQRIAVLISGGLTALNGIYYGQMAQSNYTEKRTEKAVRSRRSSAG